MARPLFHRLAPVAALAALAAAFALPASAHYGDRWFWTAAATQRSIQNHYNVAGVSCRAPRGWEVSAYSAHSLIDKTGARRWDHFICGLAFSGAKDDVCIAVAHMTGQYDGDYYLGTFPYKGCTPYKLRRVA